MTGLAARHDSLTSPDVQDRTGHADGLTFRPDIEGLRAVAVLLVVADHVVAWPRAGFVGVDVFFVISGYLITGLLVREFDTSGRISIPDFYRRRVRRILPVAMLALLVTFIAAQVLFFAYRAKQVTTDVLWSAGFLANVHFARIGTDYFQADRQPSPVQHYWSLSVEEQFYVLWPLLLWVVLVVARRVFRARARRAVGVATLTLLAVTFVLALQQTSADRSAAYFATTSRAWELGIGAFLAVCLSGGIRLPAWLRQAGMLLGLIMIAASAVVISPTSAFPAPAALAPTLGAGLIIFAGAGGPLGWAASPLTNPVSRYVGRVSYSLYIWHWPVIVFAQARLDTTSAKVYFDVFVLAIMAALTVLSYHFVETPMRRLRMSTVRAQIAHDWAVVRHREPRRMSMRERGTTGPAVVASMVGACLLVVAVIALQLRPQRGQPAFAAGQTGAPTEVTYGLVVPDATMSDAINAALSATSWPRLQPSLDKLPSARVPQWKPCGNVGDDDRLAKCTFRSAASGAATKKAVIFGDSIAITWLPAMLGLRDRGYDVYGITYGQCPATDVSVAPAAGAKASFTTECDQHRQWAIKKIKELQPDVVVLASSEDTLSRLKSGATGQAAFNEWQAGTTKIITEVQDAGAKRVVVLAPPPRGPSLQTCVASTSTPPSECVGRISDNWHGLNDAERSASMALNVTYIDVRLLFCATNDYCPAFVGTTPVRVDGNHLTEGYSTELGPILAPLIG